MKDLLCERVPKLLPITINNGLVDIFFCITRLVDAVSQVNIILNLEQINIILSARHYRVDTILHRFFNLNSRPPLLNRCPALCPFETVQIC